MLKRLERVTTRLINSPDRKHVLRGYGQVLAGFLRFAWLRPGLFPYTYASFSPDSVAIFKAHPDVDLLRRKWTQGNRRNNAGDLGRFYALLLNLQQLDRENIPGDFAEVGVYKGNSAAVLAHVAAPRGRTVFLFDTFGGFDPRDLVGIDGATDHRQGFSDTSMPGVRRLVGHDDHCRYVQGYFPASITADAASRTYAFVHVDCDLYKPTQAALEFFYPRLSPGGILCLHDYSSGLWAGVTQAVDEFSRATGEPIVLLQDKSGTALIRKRLA